MTEFYNDETFKLMLDSKQWPKFERPEFLDELHRIADEAYKKETVEGFLASILIYQQLLEELTQLLFERNNLFIRARVYPLEIKFKNMDGLTFDKKINVLNYCIQFNNKEKFITASSAFNDIRNKLVHKLTKKSSLEEIKKLGKEANTHFESAFNNFDLCNLHINQCLLDIAKSDFEEPFQEYMISEHIQDI